MYCFYQISSLQKTLVKEKDQSLPMSPRNNTWSEVFFGVQSCKPQTKIPFLYPHQGELSKKRGGERKKEGEKTFLEETIVRHRCVTVNLKKRQNMGFLLSCQEIKICHKDFLIRARLSVLSGSLASTGESSERHTSCLCSVGLDMPRAKVTARHPPAPLR